MLVFEIWRGVVWRCVVLVFRHGKAWRRPTLPRLETQYHWRGGVSRPSSGRDRVLGPSLWPPGRVMPDLVKVCLGVVSGFCGVFVLLDRAVQGCAAVHGGLICIDGLGEDKPDERLVRLGCTHCWASTCLLSTWWSTTALQGDLILRGASRLDAFSGYPVRT